MTVPNINEKARRGELVRKRATYECGCARAVDSVPGQDPCPPMQCPEHNVIHSLLETLDIPKGQGS